MKRDYPEHPLVGVGAVIVDRGRAVVVRRATEPLKGEWSIPGGLLELGETVRAAVAREAREETGLEVEPGEVVGVFDRVVPDEQGRIRYHYVLIDLLCRRVSGELHAGGDAAEARWLTAEELKTFPLAEPAAGLLARALSKAPAS